LRNTARWTLLFLTSISFQVISAYPQDDPRLQAMASWVALDMATGYETRLAPGLAERMPDWSADQWGNLVSRVGSGTPRRLIACALDRPSYAITQITEAGYLRVHRIGRGSRHPLWDQAFEAQQVRILTVQGPVAGVVGRTNGHFAQQHRGENEVSTADDLWVDVGAESAQQVTGKMGIELLDPISRHLPPWVLESGVAGPDSGRRVGCAAVATLARLVRNAGILAGEIHFVLSAQEGFGWVGLSSLIARNERFDEVILLAPGASEGNVEQRPAQSLGSFGGVLAAQGVTAVTWIEPEVRSAGSHVEGIQLDEALSLVSEAARRLGISFPRESHWEAAPQRAALRTDFMDESLEPVAQLLERLVERHGIPGHEWSVRKLVLESLPGWARDRAIVDGVGNIFVEAGPAGEATVFMAHMDEVGYAVESMAADGVVALQRLGGAVSTAWEGQTALLHFDPIGAPSIGTGNGNDIDPGWKSQSLSAVAPPPVRGVFLTRESADEKNLGRMEAWFGLDAEELSKRGLSVGSAVTSHKEGLRLGPTRFVARALDDRAGTAALLRAINSLDPDKLRSRVIFAWSVAEEGGLRGAAVLANRFGRTTRRIYSVDTFVSSDTPLESPHFAYAPLGNGPVLRAIENSGASPDQERVRVFTAALRAGIPLQIGLTQGGTDGTRFTFWGAPNQGLSWPGRYSHSPGEVLDLRDLTHLSQLIVAVALTP